MIARGAAGPLSQERGTHAVLRFRDVGTKVQRRTIVARDIALPVLLLDASTFWLNFTKRQRIILCVANPPTS
eukprot:4204037-Amphidinium_carterae.1